MALLAAYNFDEASGDLLDVTGNGNDIPLSGSLSRGTGNTNTGLVKSGGTTEMTPVTPFGQTPQRTLMTWVQRSNSTTQNTWVIGYVPSSTGSGTWGLIFLSGQLELRTKNSAGTVASAATTAPASDGVWRHLAGTYDGTDLRLYVDSALVATTPQTDLYDANDEFYFLLTAGTDTTIDDVRIYDEALDQATITTLMDTPVFSGPAPVEELSGSLSLTLDTAGGLMVPPATIADLSGSLALTLSTTGELTVPTPSVPDLAGSLPLTLTTPGTLEMPPATVDSLAGSLELTLSLDGTLTDPNATDGDYTAEVNHVTYSATALVPEHTAEVEA